jgi:hypothetical protein
MALFNSFNPFERVATNQYGLVGKNIARGSLVSFYYPTSNAAKPNPIHDPYPMVIITDIWPMHLRGVNLHYLTFPYIKNILVNNCNNLNYNYQGNIKGDQYVSNAFRTYFRKGMRNIKKLDGEFLVKILSAVRSFSESEIERVREEIRNQILSNMQIKADQLTKLSNQQVNNTTNQLQQTLQRGVTNNLMYPQQVGTGTKSANYPVPPGGPLGTGNLY